MSSQAENKRALLEDATACLVRTDTLLRVLRIKAGQLPRGELRQGALEDADEARDALDRARHRLAVIYQIWMDERWR